MSTTLRAAKRKMGDVNRPSPVLLLLAAFSRYDEALAWARDRARHAWGAIELESSLLEFSETDYYEATMGRDLKKVFFACSGLVDPGGLVDIKLATNQWEQEYAAAGGHPEPRPLNLDPGYLALGKLVLASTKDHCHRIYLDRGIYAEVTLHYQHGRWRHHRWTFADYRREDYHEFFTKCRQYLHSQTPKEGPR